jgi:hypothetical protein
MDHLPVLEKPDRLEGGSKIDFFEKQEPVLAPPVEEVGDILLERLETGFSAFPRTSARNPSTNSIPPVVLIRPSSRRWRGDATAFLSSRTFSFQAMRSSSEAERTFANGSSICLRLTSNSSESQWKSSRRCSGVSSSYH